MELSSYDRREDKRNPDDSLLLNTGEVCKLRCIFLCSVYWLGYVELTRHQEECRIVSEGWYLSVVGGSRQSACRQAASMK